MPQFTDIRQNSDPDISNFRISGISLIKEASDDIDMKLGPVAKLHKRNKTTSKKFDDKVISKNCNVIVIFPVYGQFGVIRKADSGRIVICTKSLTSTKLRRPWY